MNGEVFKVYFCNQSSKQVPSGTAFGIDVKRNFGEYYLLTAYHVIQEAYARNFPVIVCDEENISYSTQIVFPDSINHSRRNYSYDYALLVIHSEKPYNLFSLNQSSTYHYPLHCYVRGATSIYNTKFASFSGTFYGEEKVCGDTNNSIVLDLNFRSVVNNANDALTDYEILRGLSGSPICLQENDECVGVLGNLTGNIITGTRQFGVPINFIIKECLQPKGLCDNSFLKYNASINDYASTTIDILFNGVCGDVKEFCLDNPNHELALWDIISNMFYKRSNIELILRDIIEGKGGNIPIDAQVAIEYCYSRLLFKMGKNKDAYKFMDNSVVIKSNKLSPNASKRIKALLFARKTVEQQIENVSSTISLINQTSSRITALDVPDFYIANELSSLYGRCLTNLFAVPEDIKSSDKNEIIKLCNEHTRLLSSFPDKLKKQDVVNTSLNWFVGFWRLNDNDEDMDHIIHKGFEQSKTRKNSIFYIQCCLAYSIYQIEIGKKLAALFCGFLSIKLLKSNSIAIDHEGIKQLFVYLKKNHIEYYVIFNQFFSINNVFQFDRFSSICNLYNIGVTQKQMLEIINNVDYIYTLYFVDNKTYEIEFFSIPILGG